MRTQRRLSSLFWFLKEIFWRREGGIVAVLYAILQLWDTIVARLPENWGFRQMNAPWYFWLITILTITVVYVLVQANRLSAHRFELTLELFLLSKPPNSPHGRHIGLHIRNRSSKKIIDFLTRIDDKYIINGNKPNPPLHVRRKDPFDWSSWEDPASPMKPRQKLTIEPGQQKVADIIVVGPNKKKAFAALQTKYDLLGGNGKYKIGLLLEGVYENGGDFDIPVVVKFDYSGTQDIKNLEISATDRRIIIKPSISIT